MCGDEHSRYFLCYIFIRFSKSFFSSSRLQTRSNFHVRDQQTLRQTTFGPMTRLRTTTCWIQKQSEKLQEWRCNTKRIKKSEIQSNVSRIITRIKSLWHGNNFPISKVVISQWRWNITRINSDFLLNHDFLLTILRPMWRHSYEHENDRRAAVVKQQSK